MQRENFKVARDFFSSQGKVASENGVSKEDLLEIGMVGAEIDTFQKTAHYMAKEFTLKVAELMGDKAMTAPDSQGETPLQAEMGDKAGPNPGMAVKTDHAAKPGFEGAQAQAMKMVDDLTNKNELEGPSGKGEGKTLVEHNVTSPTETESNGAKEKVASDKRTRVLNALLGS